MTGQNPEAEPAPASRSSSAERTPAQRTWWRWIIGFVAAVGAFVTGLATFTDSVSKLLQWRDALYRVFPPPSLPAAIITDYIRCEARLGIQAKAISIIRIVHGDSALTALLEARLGQIWVIDDRRLNPTERGFYLFYLQTKISYDFFLDGWAGAAPSGPPTFTRSETFQDLVTRQIPGCDTGPLVSTVGMTAWISEFIDLNETAPLVLSGRTASQSTGNGSDFTKTLYFRRVRIPTSSPLTGVPVALAGLTEPIASPSRGEEYAVRVKLSLGAPRGAASP